MNEQSFIHYKSRQMKYYFEEKDTLVLVYLPTASPKFMMLEEVWSIAKQDMLVLKHYSSFEDFREKDSCILEPKDLV